MKIIATSDFHGALPVGIDECDLLVIAGDISPFKSQHLPKEQIEWFMEKFIPWMQAQPAGMIILIGGNHDFFLETEEGIKATVEAEHIDERFYYLQDVLAWWPSLEDAEEISIYGTPWTPNLPRWAFQIYDDFKPPREPFTPEPLCGKDVFSKIPERLDILVSHGPPLGYGDKVSTSHVGCRSLLQAVEQKEPQILICGHIHEGYGHYKCGKTDIYCVSHMTRRYEPTNRPVEIEL